MSFKYSYQATLQGSVNVYTFVLDKATDSIIINIRLGLLITSLISFLMNCSVIYFIMKHIRSFTQFVPQTQLELKSTPEHQDVIDPKTPQAAALPPLPPCNPDLICSSAVHSTQRVQNTENRQRRYKKPRFLMRRPPSSMNEVVHCRTGF